MDIEVLKTVFALLVAPLALAYVRLQNQFNAVQEERVKDAQKTVDRLVGATEAINANTSAVEELRKDFQRSGRGG